MHADRLGRAALAAIVGALLISVFFSGCTARKEYNTTSVTNQIFNEVEWIENLSNVSSNQTINQATDNQAISNKPAAENQTASNKSGPLVYEGNGFYGVRGCATIKESGKYRLRNNISMSDSCFVIKSDNVDFDCLGHSITGVSRGYAFYVEPPSGERFVNVSISGCVIKGPLVGISAMYIDNIKLERNEIYEAGNGIVLQSAINARIIGNTMSGCPRSMALFYCSYCNISLNTFEKDSMGVMYFSPVGGITTANTFNNSHLWVQSGKGLEIYANRFIGSYISFDSGQTNVVVKENSFSNLPNSTRPIQGSNAVDGGGNECEAPGNYSGIKCS